MTTQQIIEAYQNQIHELEYKLSKLKKGKQFCLLVDNGTDGFEMGGFFRDRDSLPDGWEEENHQLWDIESGELLEERWN